jgi:hypothetical protein
LWATYLLIDKKILERLYIAERKSIPDVAIALEISRSKARDLLIKNGVQLRSRAEGVRFSAHKIGIYSRGKNRVFTTEWKHNMSVAARNRKTTIGFRINTNGYIEITVGENKGRHQHDVIMEEHIGRKLLFNECVHHIDRNRKNNDFKNLRLMTKIEHSRLHAKENYVKRKRSPKGRFI